LPSLFLGAEWIVDAHGCDPSRLRSRTALARLFALIVDELGLNPVADPVWHVFPGEGGITGVQLLGESHLACHTFPESAFAAFNLYCCRPSKEWPWAERLAEALGAAEVRVRWMPRGEIVSPDGRRSGAPES
jgi:S-adenosylmethionine decarboxylase